MKKCPSSIRCWVSNPQPLEHESPIITTRPGLVLIFAEWDATAAVQFFVKIAKKSPCNSGKPRNNKAAVQLIGPGLFFSQNFSEGFGGKSFKASPTQFIYIV